MKPALLVPVFYFMLLAGCASSQTKEISSASRFVPHDCDAELASANATCGSIAVPENHAKPDDKKIDLNIIVFNALEPGAEKAAQFDFEGGPGFAVTESASFYAEDGIEYRRHRDVVLMDIRGTGKSNPLRCTALEQYQLTPAPLYPPELVAACARELSEHSDLRQYSTAAASKDIDIVRETLGYKQIDLNALSYGTTLSLRYIEDYPQHVRTAVLTGTVPASKTPPAHHAVSAENGLKLLQAECAADKKCASQYLALEADLTRASQQLDPTTRALFFEKLRTLMYLPFTARGVPKFILQVANGNRGFLEKKSGGRDFSDGLYLSITCSESLARMNVDQAIAESERTAFSAYRLQRQRDACKQWPIAAADPKLFRIGKHEVPILFVSGSLDPVTPSEWAAEVATRFPNSRLLVVPGGGHALEGMSGLDTCMDVIMLKFVAEKSVRNLDTACINTMSAGDFASP